MGYTTEFDGVFNLNKPLDMKTHNFLTKLAETRRMARNLPEKYGVEGEFYVDGSGDFGQAQEPSIIDYNRPPKTQPGLWCKWVPNEDGTAIEWSGAEKFYDYVEWLEYIIKNFLAPKDYVLNGDVKYEGEDSEDFGIIHVVDNVVERLEGKRKIPKSKLKAKLVAVPPLQPDPQQELLRAKVQAAQGLLSEVLLIGGPNKLLNTAWGNIKEYLESL